jgi:hypothetical protein
MKHEQETSGKMLFRTFAFPRISGRPEITILNCRSRGFKHLGNLAGKKVRNGLNGIANAGKLRSAGGGHG